MYPNNSIITIKDIGQDSDGLFCFTSATNCCRYLDGSSVIHDWHFPNDSRVENKDTRPISRSRGPRCIILHHDNIFKPSGIYRCQIHNTNVYFGIYLPNIGNFSQSIPISDFDVMF